MSNLTQIQHLQETVHLIQPDFNKLAKVHNVVNFDEEASFALQILQDNDFLARVAAGNIDSLKRAILNVAAIGLSLNPYKAEAYLIPRKGKVCLDISYKGYVQLFLDAGALKKVDVMLVRKNDIFEYQGPDNLPRHVPHIFDQDSRGSIVGGYAAARLANGELILTFMTTDEIHAIRERSEGWRAHKAKGLQTPWVTDYEEMCKKTLIRRARKSWPMLNIDRISQADLAIEESDVRANIPAIEGESIERQDMMLKIRTALEILGKPEIKYIAYLNKITGHAVTSLEDLSFTEMKQSNIALSQLVDQKNHKEINEKPPRNPKSE